MPPPSPYWAKLRKVQATRYERLPDSLRNISRKPLWELGQNSAGLALRFSSNSTTIAAKWNVLFESQHEPHDPNRHQRARSLLSARWQMGVVVNSGRPSEKENTATIISNMKPKKREYMLYLPLYDGITSLAIGVDSFVRNTLNQQFDLPVREKPLVFYGTSIMQGGCASRPGMAHTNILSRWFNREIINLGL